ncbi:MAG TPA: alpha/beta hydrolase, partial [Mycobacterium sp.]|nr:alpha/beta hydrolase [Mycobacterium sp.]
MRALLGLVLVTTVIAGCAAKPRDPAFAGRVDVGDGRALYMDCQGTGSPVVFIIPGKGSYAGMWNAVVPDEDQIQSSPYDVAVRTDLLPSPAATQPTVAKTTRVCSYDRPNTRSGGTDRSTSIPQPHSIQQDVDDVVKLIAAVHLPTPLVIVSHSYGGLIADLLARTHPELVSGLVFVDPTSEFQPRLGRPEQDAEFNHTGRAPMPAPDGEGFLVVDAYTRIKVAPLLPKVPTIVLSSDKFPPPADLGPDDYTKFQIHQANSLLAETLATENVIVPGSGHDIMLYAPQVVADK